MKPAVICDLDGVVYRGDRAIPGSPQALRRIREAGRELWLATNNSTRPPRSVADKIADLTGVTVSERQVLVSPAAATAVMTAEDAPCLVVGEGGIEFALAESSLATTTDPAVARSVIVGLARHADYRLIAAAAAAVRSGARFIATNDDSTYPTNDGVLPGAGAIVAAIATAAGVTPEVAGKPNHPMRRLIRSMGVGPAWVVGDRLDTDIAMAEHEDDWRSILVLSGITETPDAKADFVCRDLAEAVDLLLSEP